MRRTRVRVGARLDRAGQAVLIGFPNEGSAHMADDRMLREMTSDPKFRKVLVTDGKTAVGQALVQALVKAGADIVWVGHAEPWKKLRRARRHHGAAAGDAGAARPHQRPLGDRAGRRDRRQGRHRRSTTPRCTAPSASPRAAAPTSPRPRWTSTTSALLRLAQEFGPALKGRVGRRRDQRDRVGQPAVDLRAQQLSAARHLSARRRRRRIRWRNACAPRCGRPASA